MKEDYYVPGTGFEPARRFQHHHLKVACLPISTPGLKDGKSKMTDPPCQIYFFNSILNVVPFPNSECFTYKCPLWY